jgi:hypothetical protein
MPNAQTLADASTNDDAALLPGARLYVKKKIEDFVKLWKKPGVGGRQPRIGQNVGGSH